MRKSILSFVLILSMTLLLLSVFLTAASAAESEKCGENLNWTLDSNGILTISGTGDMDEYTYESELTVPWEDNQEDIKKVIINEGVTSIGSGAFGYCRNMTEITIADSITQIGEMAFYDCGNLTVIDIPAGVTSIGYGAFWNCGQIKEITIPNGITDIKGMTFSGCGSLINVTVPEGVRIIGGNAFSNCFSLETVLLPDTVEAIEEFAFHECSNLDQIDIPDGVKKIERFTFAGCYQLNNVTIPDTVTDIEEFAFYKCVLISNLVIDGVENISNDAFSACYDLNTVLFGKNIKNIGKSAFSGCRSITDVYCAASEKEWNSVIMDVDNIWLTNANIHYNTITDVSFNGEAINFNRDTGYPFIESGRTLIPLRVIFEALGAKVEWDEATSTVSSIKDGISVSLVIGSDTLIKNGEEIKLDVVAKIINGRTFVPVRAIAEGYGFDVEWDDVSRRVDIIR